MMPKERSNIQLDSMMPSFAEKEDNTIHHYTGEECGILHSKDILT